MFKDKMCKTTVAPSDGLGTSVQLGVEIRHAGMLCLFRFSNDADRFIFVKM